MEVEFLKEDCKIARLQCMGTVVAILQPCNVDLQRWIERRVKNI